MRTTGYRIQPNGEQTELEADGQRYGESPFRAFYFYRPSNAGEGPPVDIEKELRACGGFRDIVIDEEAEGDGHWHVAAFDDPDDGKPLDERLAEMRGVAERTQSRFDGGLVVRTDST